MLTNKRIYVSGTIILEENGILIKDEKKLVEKLNNHYINIVETTIGAAPTNLGNPVGPMVDSNTVDLIIQSFKYNLIIVNTKENVILQSNFASFSFQRSTKEEINCILKTLILKVNQIKYPLNY